MEIKTNETFEDYFVRKGYYSQIEDVLPSEINPGKFSYIFDRCMVTIIIYENEALSCTNRFYLKGNTKYELSDKTITVAEAKANISRMREILRNKEKEEKSEGIRLRTLRITTDINNPFESRCQRFAQLYGLLITPTNALILKELIEKFVKIDEYTHAGFSLSDYYPNKDIGYPYLSPYHTIIDFKYDDKFRTLKHSCYNNGDGLYNIIEGQKQEYANDVKKRENDAIQKGELEKKAADLKRTETYIKNYELVTKYKKREEAKLKIDELRKQIELLEKDL
jgi:hypothetical protein